MIQTRNEEGGLLAHSSVALAFDAAKRDLSIWKISYDNEDGSRTRLVKDAGAWIYQPLLLDNEYYHKTIQ